MNVSGHLWTSVPSVVHRLWPGQAPPAEPWSTTLRDPDMGRLTLRGELRHRPNSRGCLIVVHGLGGTTDAFYCIKAALAAEALGLSCLRIALRGADREGEDFYHAGLTADLEAAVGSPALAQYEDLFVMGYSLGGHMALRFGLQPKDGRVRAIAAICPPLDLSRTADAIDHPRSHVYRFHILSALNEIYAAVARRRQLPTSIQDVRCAGTMREWDRRAVVPRHGFGTVDNYYASMSVGPQLGELQVPTLILHSDRDPMIPPDTYAHLLGAPWRQVTLASVPVGGHVAFPPEVNLGQATQTTAEHQAIAWLMQRR